MSHRYTASIQYAGTLPADKIPAEEEGQSIHIDGEHFTIVRSFADAQPILDWFGSPAHFAQSKPDNEFSHPEVFTVRDAWRDTQHPPYKSDTFNYAQLESWLTDATVTKPGPKAEPATVDLRAMQNPFLAGQTQAGMPTGYPKHLYLADAGPAGPQHIVHDAAEEADARLHGFVDLREIPAHAPEPPAEVPPVVL